MKPDYERLLRAAREVKHWETAAATAAGFSHAGYAVSEQTMTNWKARGLSRECKLRAAQILGIRIAWIQDGTGPMLDATQSHGYKTTIVASQGNVHHFVSERAPDAVEKEVLSLMAQMTEEGKWYLAGEAKQLAVRYPKINQLPSSQ